MALKTLEKIKEIDGFEVREAGAGWSWDEKIMIDHSKNVIAFKIQNGAIKENGVNGCQVDTMIEAAKLIIDGLNEQFPCHENEQTIIHLQNALFWLNHRKKNREKRGVEGHEKA